MVIEVYSSAANGSDLCKKKHLQNLIQTPGFDD
jgi:hypothetical protein